MDGGGWGHTFSVCEVMAAPLDRGMMFEVMKLDERIVQRRPWRCLVMCGKHTGHALVSVGTSVGARPRWTRGSRALRQPRSGRPSGIFEWPPRPGRASITASSGFQIVLGRLLADPTRMPLSHCTRRNTRPVAQLGRGLGRPILRKPRAGPARRHTKFSLHPHTSLTTARATTAIPQLHSGRTCISHLVVLLLHSMESDATCLPARHVSPS